jgi:hypothetical protein
MNIPKVTKIDAYRTSDGEIFTCLSDAVRHERYMSFEKWYDSSSVVQIPGVCSGIAFDWLTSAGSILVPFISDDAE